MSINAIVVSLQIIVLGYIVWVAFDVTKKHKRINKLLKDIDLRQANHNLMKENYELLKALKEAVMIIDGAYPSDNKFIAAVIAKFKAMINRLEEN